jgi:hypothetical protein
MPMGSEHQISGIIERGRFGHVLLPDDGGVWELEGGMLMRWRLRFARGRHVMLSGTRIDFNALHVRRIGRLG